MKAPGIKRVVGLAAAGMLPVFGAQVATSVAGGRGGRAGQLATKVAGAGFGAFLAVKLGLLK